VEPGLILVDTTPPRNYDHSSVRAMSNFARRSMEQVRENFDPSAVKRIRGGEHYHSCSYCEDEHVCYSDCLIDHDLSLDDDGAVNKYYGSPYVCDQCETGLRFRILMRNAACKNTGE
jgi:hypothetical protein